MQGILPLQKENKITKMPFLLVFTISTQYSLSLVSHKEQRFMSSLFPIIAVMAGNGFLHLGNQGDKYYRYYFIRWILLVYIVKETMHFIPQFSSDKLLYTLFHDRSPLALDLSAYSGPEYDFSSFTRVESVFVINKYGTAMSTLAHSHSSEE